MEKKPLIEFESKGSITSSTYTQLINWKPNPNKITKILEIALAVDSTGLSAAQFKININNEDKILDKYLNSTTPIILKFNGLWEFKDAEDPGIKIYVKSDGSTSVLATVWITGVEE